MRWCEVVAPFSLSVFCGTLNHHPPSEHGHGQGKKFKGKPPGTANAKGKSGGTSDDRAKLRRHLNRRPRDQAKTERDVMSLKYIEVCVRVCVCV